MALQLYRRVISHSWRVGNGCKEQDGSAAGRDLQHLFRLADVTLGFITPSCFGFRLLFTVFVLGGAPVLIDKLIVINLLWAEWPEK